MADTPVIEAASRAGVGKGAARAARREGYVPGVVYGDGKDPVSVNIRMNTLMRALKAGKFLSKLINLKIDGADNRVICRAVQRDVVRDLPIHADFLRLSEKSRIALFIPVEFINRPASPGLKKGGVLTIVRPEVELRVAASDIPDHLTVDLTGLDIGDVIKISNVDMPAGATPTISDRDFVIANISAPSALIAEDEEEAAEGAAGREEGGEEAEKESEEE